MRFLVYHNSDMDILRQKRTAVIILIIVAVFAIGWLLARMLTRPDARQSSRPVDTAAVVVTSIEDIHLRPPFKKVWGISGNYLIQDFVVVKDIVYHCGDKPYGAIDLTTGKQIWENTLPDNNPSSGIASDGRMVFVIARDWQLIVCDAETGQKLWNRPIRGHSSQPMIHQSILYCELNPLELTAIDVETQKTLWSVNLKPKSPIPYVLTMDNINSPQILFRPILCGRTIVAATSSGELIGLDYETGEILWRRPVDRPKDGSDNCYTGVATDGTRIYFTTHNGLVAALDSETGKTDWQFVDPAGIPDQPAVGSGVAAYSNYSGTLVTLDAASGRKLWSEKLEIDPTSHIGAAVIYEGQVITSVHNEIISFDVRGNKLWSWEGPEDLNNQPLAIYGDGFFLNGEEFSRYTVGEDPRIPKDKAERIKLATQLSKRLDKLTNDEKYILRNLGDEAFEVLLPIAKTQLQHYKTLLEASNSEDSDKRKQTLSRLNNLAVILLKVAGKHRTSDVLSLLDLTSDAYAREWFIRWLIDNGSDRLNIPYFIKLIKNNRLIYETHDSTVQIIQKIARSSSPEAVQFMIDQLKDESADPRVRLYAFANLANVGGKAGQNAVIDIMSKANRTACSFAEFMMLDTLQPVPRSASKESWGSRGVRSEVLAVSRDRSGNLWALAASSAIGSNQDLWLLKRTGGSWSDPIFTGAEYENLGYLDWTTGLVPQANTLAKDSDGDGWSDLIEKRIGTDPAVKDSDGDGLYDSEDMNPLVAPRKLTDTEQVVAAAFRTVVRFSPGMHVPCIVDYSGIPGSKPFELPGNNSAIIPLAQQGENSLRSKFGQGVCIIKFSHPHYDFAGNETFGRNKPAVLWNKSHTEAKVHISILFDNSQPSISYDVHLKKFNTHWLPIGLKQGYYGRKY